MKNLVKLLLLLTLTFTLCSAQTVGPYGVSPRDAAADAADIYDLSYNGVTNVGVGTKVYVVGTVTDSAGLQTPTWEITKMPFGSTATLGATDDIDASWLDTHADPAEWNYIYKQVTSFVADVAGEYEITFTNGTSDPVTVRIHTAKYLGVDNCKACHSSEGLGLDTKYEEWLTTGHSDMLERGLNGTASSHYASYCVPCHATGYDTNSENDGFDDFDFEFPAHPAEGVYDSLAAIYQDAFKRANIQCESCHGPGSGHLGVKENIAVTFDSDNCAWCHDSGTHHVYPEQWDVSGHASGHTLYDRGSCAPCHNGQGFIQMMKGQEVAVDGMYPITCATCHDPHDGTNIHQLRTLEATLTNGYVVEDGGRGRLCMNCHKTRRTSEEYAIDQSRLSSHYGPHHGPQADMITGQNLALNGMTIQSNYGHYTFIEQSCVGCHMKSGHTDDDGNVLLSGSHSFRMSTPDGVDNMDACSGCHPSYATSFDAVVFEWNGVSDFDEDGDGTEGLQAEVAGLLETLAKLIPPLGEATIDYELVDANYTTAYGVGFYNYQFVLEDRSGGIHNPKLAISLLQENIRALGGYVSVNSPGIVPEEYRLSQNYPNPFNPTTVIEYGLPVESNVTITIYNALGEVVETLVDEVKGAGNHTVDFNASQLASGVYIYRLQADNFVQVKKMMLMK